MSCPNIKISPTVILIMLCFALFGKLEIFLLFYLSAFLHELSHYIVCLVLNEKVKRFEILLYGICLKTEFIKNPCKSALVSFAGPFFSFIMYIIFKNYFYFFSMSNFVIFMVNIIPALPLDGGEFVKSLLIYKLGYIKSYKIMIQMTKIFSFFIIFLGIILIIVTKYNISLLIIGLFLLYNIKYEKNNLILLKKKLICNELSENAILSVKSIAAYSDIPVIKCIDYFSYGSILNVTVFTRDNKKIGVLSQYEISEAFLRYGINTQLGDLISLKGI